MFKIFLIITFFISHAQAWVKSVNLGFTRVTSDILYQDGDKKSLLEFRPKVATGQFVGFETKHVALGYVFAGKLSEEEAASGESKFQDFRFNFHISHFDFRLSLQSYLGALVDEGGKQFFYKNYDVKSTNARFHYYFNAPHLEFIRPGQALARRLASHSGFRASGSWLLGINLDDRHIRLPQALQAEHQAILTAKGIDYNSQFSALSWGPMAGYDALLEVSSIFLRFKLALGSAFQGGGGTSTQSEIALMFGGVIAKNHLITVGTDMFGISFKEDRQYIQNDNTLTNVQYTYAF
jgi:hypothetical protein